GMTIGKTDYTNSQIGGRLSGGIEYYLPTSSNHIFGFGGFGGGQEIKNKADNKIITIPGTGPVVLPDIVNTDMYLAGLSLIYSYSIKDEFFPYLSLGLSNLWFNPRTEDGRRAPRNSNSEYERSAISYDAAIGIK